MAAIKAYTDISQSKTLSKILPLESADCFWDYDDLQKYHRISWFEEGYDKDSQLRPNENNVCAWSLAALLGVLPNMINRYFKTLGWWNSEWNCAYMDEDGEIKYNSTADNHVDACYEMIIRLHELNLL